MPDSQNGNWMTVFLALLGASAGLTFVLYVVGGFVEVRRYETLKLPGSQTIAPLSRDSLIAYGARALFVPLLGAAAGAGLFVILALLRKWRGKAVALAVCGPIVIVLCVFARLTGTGESVGFVLLLAVCAVVGLFVDASVPLVAAGVAAIVGVIAAAVVITHIWRPPTDLEYATIELRDGTRACGIYLSSTGDDIFIAPGRNDGDTYFTQREVLVVPRPDVRLLTLHRRIHVRDGGTVRAGTANSRDCP